MFNRALALAGALAAAGVAAEAQTAMPFALDWKFEGPSAPYFVAVDKGYFADAGLEVEISAGQGSLDAIPKVATGAFPVGFADINSLIKFLDQNPGAPVTAVMMIYDKPPFAIVGRKSLGIEEPADLEGKVLGAPPPDGAWAQFPIFAAENDLVRLKREAKAADGEATKALSRNVVIKLMKEEEVFKPPQFKGLFDGKFSYRWRRGSRE